MKETLWKNNFNFVKDLPMTYVNVIVIEVRVSFLRNNKKHYFRTAPRTEEKHQVVPSDEIVTPHL